MDIVNYQPVGISCESLERYIPGGYHPVEINDTFHNGRYVVKNKLRADAHCTVWLARDTTSQTNVTLKILTSNASTNCHELDIFAHFKAADTRLGSSRFISPLLDHFDIDGVNGTHVCFVMPFLGPDLSSPGRNWNHRYKKIRPDVSRRLASQAVSAVSEIHARGVALGGE
jgi:serine/threonine protein kinase